MTTDTPAAVLWDMDGTLVDTEPYWMRAETELVESFGGVWTHEDALQLVGLGLWESARIFQAAGVDLDADAIVDWLTTSVQQQLETDGVPWRPGARELLAELRENGVHDRPRDHVGDADGRAGRRPHRLPGLRRRSSPATTSSNRKPHPGGLPRRGRAARRGGIRLRRHRGLGARARLGRAAGAVTVGVPAHGRRSPPSTLPTSLWPTLDGPHRRRSRSACLDVAAAEGIAR